MTSHLVWQGFTVGCLAAIPLGPMGMVCLQRTLDHGRLAGMASACGLTVAASLWCVIAAQGLGTVAELVAVHKTLFNVGLGVFLAAAGIAGLAGGGRQSAREGTGGCGRLTAHFVSSLAGVLFNPVTFITMTAVLAILGGLEAKLELRALASLAAAAFVGGMSVWLGITHSVVVMKARLGQQGGVRLSKALNYCILFLGVVYVIRPLLPNTVG